MASLTSILSLINLATGESSYGGFTNWGEVQDENLRILEKAIGDVTSKTLAGTDVTLTTDEARSAIVKLSGTLSANVNVETPDVKGFWIVRNDTTGAFSVTFKTDSGNGVVVRQGSGALLFSDGTDIIEAASIADAVSLAADISGASGKTTPVDADTVPLIDSAASGVLKKLTWANIKATLKAYFDTVYTRATLGLATSDSPQFNGIELGHGSDTTLGRGAAGFLTVEGKRVPSPASQAAGDILYRGSTEWERLAKGTGTQVLYGGNAPSWGAAPVFTKSYESSQQTISDGGTVTLAHGLGAAPKMVLPFLVCVTAGGGYSEGDVVSAIAYSPDSDRSGKMYGLGITSDATNIFVRYGSDGLVIPNKNSGAQLGASTNWRLVIRAWA